LSGASYSPLLADGHEEVQQQVQQRWPSLRRTTVLRACLEAALFMKGAANYRVFRSDRLMTNLRHAGGKCPAMYQSASSRELREPSQAARPARLIGQRLDVRPEC